VSTAASVTFLRSDPRLPRDGQRALVEAWMAQGGGRLTRMCPHCGGSDHGRPRIGDRHLSLAYAPGLITVAVADVPIGVDAELDGPAPAPFPDRASWTAAEAVLKLTGEGVRREPATVLEDEAWSITLPAPEGYVATLATHAAVEVSCRTGTAAELDPPATAAAAS
jgi:4'-phosphopantetheinyl transferase